MIPQYPKNYLAQQIIATTIAKGIKHVVISPGSRNAPLTIGFTNHSEVKTYSVVDERCAAFFALGIAQQTKEPVAIVCTSGSALLNYYPAVSEAFYSDIPLVVISADRPKHMIDIGDGQTIRQENVFQNHIEASLNLVANKEQLDDISKCIDQAIIRRGPVHINAPFDEPLYDTQTNLMHVDMDRLALNEEPLDVDYLDKFAQKWNSTKKKVVLIGVNTPSELLQVQMEKIIQDPSVIVLTETTSNLHHECFINSIDKIISPLSDEELKQLQPDVLLTLGGLVVSKRIKQFLRKYKPKHHWHVDLKTGYDSYQCLEKHFKISPELFFSQFFFLTKDSKSDYQSNWLEIKEKRKQKHKQFIDGCLYSDLKVFDSILRSIPDGTNLQFSNSSIIRYSQLFDLNKSLQVNCNRGTSGIDGSTSTAIGAAVSVENQTVLITGDVSFFYDSNALWNAYIPKDFRIILLNNDGGGIFKFIPGPKESNALPYFETPHGLSADKLCSMFDIEYTLVNSIDEFDYIKKQFFEVSDKPKLMEIKTPSEINDIVLKDYFKFLK